MAKLALNESEKIKKEFFELLDEKNEEIEVGLVDGTWDDDHGVISLIDNRGTIAKTKRVIKVSYNAGAFEYKNWLGDFTTLEKELEIGLTRFN